MSDQKQEITERPAEKSLGVQLKDRETQFIAALPAHIPAERFMRVVLTAVQNNQKLARADRPSLWNACMRAAQDGLLPDGREGALVIYKTKDGDSWIDKVQWMPMIAGIRKKVRNSKEIKDWNAQVVHAKDHFEFELGDDPFIKHKPFLDGDPGQVVAAYSIACFATGEVSREVMTRAQIDKVRSVSKSKDNGPWIDWYEEMARKVVARRHAKVLPMSTDLDDLIRRDDNLYDLEGKSDKAGPRQPRLSLTEKMNLIAGADDIKERTGETIEHDADTGEIKDNKDSGDGSRVPESAEGNLAPSSEGAAAVSSSQTPAAASDAQKTQPKAIAKESPKKPADNERDALILADLTNTGNNAAAQGADALNEFLRELDADEQALISPAQRKKWLTVVQAVART